MSLFWLIRIRYMLHIQRANSPQGRLYSHNLSTVGSHRWCIWGGGGEGFRQIFLKVCGGAFIRTLIIGGLFSQWSYNLPLVPEWGVQRWRETGCFHLLLVYSFSQSRGDFSHFILGQTVNSLLSSTLCSGPCSSCIRGWTVPPQKRYARIPSPLPVNVTLFGHRVCRHNRGKARLCWIRVGAKSSLRPP